MTIIRNEANTYCGNTKIVVSLWYQRLNFKVSRPCDFLLIAPVIAIAALCWILSSFLEKFTLFQRRSEDLNRCFQDIAQNFDNDILIMALTSLS